MRRRDPRLPIATWCVFADGLTFVEQPPRRSDRLNVSNTEGTCEQYRPVKGLLLASTKWKLLAVLPPRFLLALTVGEATYLAAISLGPNFNIAVGS
jgi:hypothetical protein